LNPFEIVVPSPSNAEQQPRAGAALVTLGAEKEPMFSTKTRLSFIGRKDRLGETDRPIVKDPEFL
jgi:hypothetical protein